VLKASDGFFTTFFVNPYSVHIVRFGARRGWHPNQVTAASMLVGLFAAAAFATGERWGLISGALLLQVAFVLDCVDGQLARYTQTFSRTGGYLDAVFDRGKEYVVYAGLAAGSARTGDPEWLLAGCALALQTVRHTIDLALAERRTAEAAGPAEQPTAWTWVKRAAGFPIGERFAAISVSSALWDARVTFIVLLAWGVVGLGYVLAGAGRRGEMTTALRAAGPRALQYGGLLTLAALAGGLAEPAAYALIAVLAFLHYDAVYRPRYLGTAVPPKLQTVACAWPAQLALAAGLLAAGWVAEGYFAAAALLALATAVQGVSAARQHGGDPLAQAPGE
jgi:phosphatidylglycerophosphate synthase